MTKPVFSIITPTYNRPLLLRRNILSVRNQTFEDYEHIIVDDGNQQETEKIIDSFADERISLLKHNVQRGAAASYNTGIKASKGRFILFLDDDDEYFPCFLKKMNQRFKDSGMATGFIWTGISRIKDADSGENLLLSLVWPSRFPTKEEGLIAATSIGNGFGVCVRRECFDEIGFYDESLTVSEDTDLLFRLSQKYEFETIPEVLVKIHQHQSLQLTRTDNYSERIKGKEIVLDRYKNFLEQYSLLYSIHYKAYADLCYRSGLRKKGRKALSSVLRKTPGRYLNMADFISYELTGKDIFNTYCGKRLIGLVRFIKKTVIAR